MVYEELRKLAARKLSKEPAEQTLQATALVHEAWLDLIGTEQTSWNSRNHFFKAAAEAMRRILIANARRKKREKHGGHLRRMSLNEIEIAEQCDPDTMEMVHTALEKLANRDPIKAELVKLRFFIGLNNQEVANVLNLSEPTVKRYWAFARAWMFVAPSPIRRRAYWAFARAWMFDEISKMREESAQ